MTLAIDAALRDEVRSIARAAGDAILQIYDEGFSVEFKDDRSPLTEADRKSHELIKRALTALEPALPILSEESSEAEVSERRNWRRFWLVDPLDGTKEFIKRNGEFTVNIALIDGHEAVLGVVLAPASGVEYSAAVGQGAFRSGDGEVSQPIQVSREVPSPLRVVGSRSHANAALAAYLRNLEPYRLKPMGSSLKICLVAEGAADIYPRLGPTSEWDTAAAQAILLGAGGSMIDLTGQPLRYNTREHLLNPHFLAIGDDRRDWLAAIRSD
ncbi:3'(2'),5'-bisphosphate nucleotidase CysQ [Candidatus Rariloculus sp.]|uniref:3'(2'),5'-bisphosphate nucleotidase CysQ n=1 Tax=Candidatus Rariloculus sp. TaxID=3101265 RepID=UPI003D0E2E27